MSITLRIWLTVALIVVLFTTLVLYIVPSQQEQYLISTLNQEVQNLANTVALGTDIALNDQNFEGVEMAMDFVKRDQRLVFVALVSLEEGQKEVFQTYPTNYQVTTKIESSDSLIVKRAHFNSQYLSGEVMLGFNTVDIQKGMDRIRQIAILVSLIVFCIGILLGLWLARTISTPVRQIRDAAILVGKGDLTQHVGQNRRDEIGDLSRAFNKMVGDLSKAEEEIRTKNSELTLALDDLNIKNKQIVLEKQKSDELLLNILPEETAEELKTEGHAKPKRFEMATVMFTDFVSFTRISEGLSPEQLVSEIDYCFSNFDEIIEKYQVEKIKTIGDSYMCVGGIPVPQKNHASNCILAALEIQEFLNMNQKDRGSKSHPSFVARVGIHSGPLVAGIVGSKKFAYDVWGDTVNTASRMESSGEADMVNISVETYKLLKDDPRFHFKYRGKVKAKGKGEIEMYFVSLTKKTSEF